jgi:hypothetical protein
MDWGIIVVLILLANSYLDNTRIRRIERKLDALLRHHGVDPFRLSDRVKQLAADSSRKIEAIKVYREETGAGLAEAEEAVESFINSK